MTQKQQAFRKDLLKKIHIHALYKRLKAEDFWEGFLSEHFGVDSSKYLGITELRSILSYFDKQGVLVKDEQSRSIYTKQKRVALATEKQQYTIEKLWSEVSSSGHKGLVAFIHRIVGTRYLYLYHLPKLEAQKIIIALKRWKERVDE